MVSAFEQLAKKGVNIRCANDFTKRCHPIIGGMMVDYEEQVLITGIKKNRYCSICTVPPDERQNLTKRWEYCTHEYTKALLYDQMSDPKRENGSMAVDPVRN